ANARAASPTWTTVDDNLNFDPLPNRKVTSITIDPVDPTSVFVSFDGYAANNLRKTTDNGVNWAFAAGSGMGSLPVSPIWAVTMNPADRSDLIVGTDLGAFESIDGGASWAAATNGPGVVPVVDFAWLPGSNPALVAATNGRGAWRYDIGGVSTFAVKFMTEHAVGGLPVTAQIRLSTPAPAGGQTVNLSTDLPTSNLPYSVTVPAGQLTKTFSFVPYGVDVSQPLTLRAANGGIVTNSKVTVYPPSIESYSVSPNQVVGGNSTTGTVKLHGWAGPTGFKVQLKSASSVVTVPTSVTVPYNTNLATITATTLGVASNTVVTTSAFRVGTPDYSSALTLVPASFSSLSLSSNDIVGGNNVSLTVGLDGLAAGSGVTIQLSSSSVNAPVPASVTIPAGRKSANIVFTTVGVDSLDSSTIKASTVPTDLRSTTLTIRPATFVSLATNPTSIIDGDSVSGLVQLNGNAGNSPVVITLSANSNYLTLPPSVTIPAHQRTASFAITTGTLTPSNGAVTLTGKAGSVTRSTVLYAYPYAFTYGYSTPGNIVRGQTATITVQLRAPARVGGKTGSIAYPSGVSGPSSVTVPEGQSTATFSISTLATMTAGTYTFTISGPDIPGYGPDKIVVTLHITN
ncbi:MAG: hypothetical protein ABUL72_03950, partial [Armatimonadota bacterium]